MLLCFLILLSIFLLIFSYNLVNSILLEKPETVDVVTKSKKISDNLKKYFFEINDDVLGRKAYHAMIDAEKAIQDDDTLESDERDTLREALESYKVSLTHFPNEGLSYDLANWLMDNKTMIDYIVELELSSKGCSDSEAVTFYNIVKEMACHIKLQESGGRMSLEEYVVALKTNLSHKKSVDEFAEDENKLGEIFKNKKKMVEEHLEVIKEDEIGKIVFTNFEDYIKKKSKLGK